MNKKIGEIGIKFKKGDTVKIVIDYERLKKDRKFNGMTGIIFGSIDLRAVDKDDSKKESVVPDFGYVVFLHRKRELCYFSPSELQFDDEYVKKKRIEEAKERFEKNWGIEKPKVKSLKEK